ncbi:hypothetical protein [Desulfosporosinus hippei]|uniref:Uncharacterized protein n=1 Tax=Desulfosporosinus hippei DSM 8344 TaxID=1121419 RepID=A0A1G7UIW1_9FIRM|nr:hypothetical protein [Desulfosporosinus hippei]SDG47427.1 hypothetical protein SAMN05443529_103157 [Desulfosporosinus hippei DSM 8344]
MALTKLTEDVANVQKLTDKPTESATQVKVLFDKAGEDIKTYLNDVHIPELESVSDGASGADKIGTTPISAIGVQATVQSVIEALITRLQAVTATSGAKFIGVQSISGLTGNDVQVLLSALKTYIDNHKTSSDHDSRYFTETELGAVTDGSSGADKIGATPISSSPSTVQGILEWLKTQIDTIVSGGVADGSVTDAKLSSTTGQIKERVATLTTTYNTHAALFSSETVKGHVELATAAETTTGTDTTRAVHPAGLKVELDKKIPLTQKGATSGVCDLDSSTHVPANRLAVNAMSAISTEGLVWELLATQTFTVDTANFTWSSIPAGYTAFRIVGELDGFDSSIRDIIMSFNGVTTDTEYISHNLVNGVYSSSTTANGIQINVRSDTGNRRLLDVVISNTGKYHQIYATHGGQGHLGMTSGEFEDTTLITSIKLSMSSFDADSTFKLFGSKTAL